MNRNLLNNNSNMEEEKMMKESEYEIINDRIENNRNRLNILNSNINELENRMKEIEMKINKDEEEKYELNNNIKLIEEKIKIYNNNYYYNEIELPKAKRVKRMSSDELKIEILIMNKEVIELKNRINNNDKSIEKLNNEVYIIKYIIFKFLIENE